MFERILRFAIAQRWLVMLAVLVMAALGFYNYGRLPIDAVPDITNVQVQINTAAPGYSPLESEQRITYPIETVMAGLPGLVQTRSLSRYGLSQVTVIFRDGTDIHFARQLVSQRIQDARAQLPAGVAPQMGPISTGLGEIYLWTVEAEPDARKPDGTPYTATDLREIQDWLTRSAASPRNTSWRRTPRSWRPTACPSSTWCRRWSATTATSAPAISSGAASSTWCGRRGR
jgi:cobalt-zinc-cadmium resistance protein CzcA